MLTCKLKYLKVNKVLSHSIQPYAYNKLLRPLSKSLNRDKSERTNIDTIPYIKHEEVLVLSHCT